MRNARPRPVAILSADPELVRAIVGGLKAAGHDAAAFPTADATLASAQRRMPGVILIDGASPPEEAGTLMTTLRMRFGYSIVVIGLIDDMTDRGVGTAVRMLEGGTDLCVPRRSPFPLLSAQVTAGLRRSMPPSGDIDAAMGHLRFQSQGMRIYVDDVAVTVTAKEYALALLLCRNIDTTLLREDIFRSVWPEGVRPATRSLDVHVSRLRTKLALNGERGYRVFALYGKGYRLEQVRAKDPAAQMPPPRSISRTRPASLSVRGELRHSAQAR